jgi:hypothetical protein
MNDLIKGLLGAIVVVGLIGLKIYSRWDRAERRSERRAEQQEFSHEFQQAIAEYDAYSERIERAGREAPEHFKNAKIRIFNVYRYEGATHLEVEGQTRMVAVHVEFRDVDPRAILEQISIIDPGTGESLTEELPDIAGIKYDGSGFVPVGKWPEEWKQFHGLLIYSVPGPQRDFKLKYFDNSLTPEALHLDLTAKLPLIPAIAEVAEVWSKSYEGPTPAAAAQ